MAQKMMTLVCCYVNLQPCQVGYTKRNNTRRVHINMVIDPREGNCNARALRAWALLFPIPRVINHAVIDTESKFI